MYMLIDLWKWKTCRPKGYIQLTGSHEVSRRISASFQPAQTLARRVALPTGILKTDHSPQFHLFQLDMIGMKR